jgi:hypothetical protein
MPRGTYSIDGGSSNETVIKTTISPYPDLPKSASSELWILRQNLEAKAIKTAPPITNLISQTIVPEDDSAMAFYKEFEYFNATALSTILRNDMVNGQNINYLPITNISNINVAYNPNNLVKLQSTLQSYFEKFEFNLDKYTPIAAEPNEEYVPYQTPETVADYEITIDFADIIGTERVEVEFLVMDTAFNDTIYT